jgi:hypothetical protein
MMLSVILVPIECRLDVSNHPAGVGFHVPSSTVPAFSQRRIVVVNTGSRANSGS